MIEECACTKDHKCYDPIKKLYCYSCEFELICAHCVSEDVKDNDSYLSAKKRELFKSNAKGMNVQQFLYRGKIEPCHGN